MKLEKAVSWIKLASASLVPFGLVVALAAHPASSGVANFLIDLVVWPLDSAPQFNSPEGRIIAGIGGGVMAGWGVMMWMIADRILSRDPATGRSLLMTGLFVWFLVDSTASLVAGAAWNVLGNTLYLIAFVYPLVRMDFKSALRA